MAPKLIVTYPGASLLEQRQHLGRGGLFLPAVEPMPEAQGSLSIELRTVYGDPVALEGLVLQVFAGAGFALNLSDAQGAQRLLAPLFAAAEADPGRPGPASLSWEGAEQAPEPASEPSHAGTLFDRIRAMSARERMTLARHGDRAERAILMKDTTKTIHVFLVQNKGITAEEIRYFAGMRQANPDALKLIADNRTWMQKPAIVTALVRNPKTPSSVAVRLLEKLPRSEIARIAKTGNAPRMVVEAAKRRINAKR